jgi:antirestriction protein ArdC
MAERGIPHSPDSHAAYVAFWLEALRQDKHEIFRAARDAHKASDLMLALEMKKSIEAALALVDKSRTSAEPHSEPDRPILVPSQPAFGSNSRSIEVEL